MLAGYPKVKAWQEALLASGIPQKSVPEDFKDQFADIYLAERTWFGRGANMCETPSQAPKAAGGGCCG